MSWGSGLRPLWQHQVEALDLCWRDLADERARTLVQLPPGTGKTEIAARLAVRWTSDPRRPFARALLVVSNTPVREQFVRRLAQLTRTPIAVEQAELRAPRTARLVVATQNSLWDRLRGYPRDTLCIYDECHHGNLDADCNLSIARSFERAVGFSATPWSRGCAELFGAPRMLLTFDEAVRRDVIAPVEVLPWEAPHGPHGLVFCGTNAEAEDLAAAHPGASWIGVNSGHVESRIATWKTGRVPVLYVNRMLLEGFDWPSCDAVWIAKDSESDIQRVQMLGRAIRWRQDKRARIYCRSEAIREGVRRALARCNGLRLAASLT